MYIPTLSSASISSSMLNTSVRAAFWNPSCGGAAPAMPPPRLAVSSSSSFQSAHSQFAVGVAAAALPSRCRWPGVVAARSCDSSPNYNPSLRCALSPLELLPPSCLRSMSGVGPGH